MEENKKAPDEWEQGELYVRIPLSNIRFINPYEQRKLIKLLCCLKGEHVIGQLEDLLKDVIFEIDFQT